MESSIRFRVHGDQVCDLFCRRAEAIGGVPREQIKEIVAKIHDDGSGLAECCALLSSGARLVLFSHETRAEEYLRTNPVLPFAKELVPEAPAGYEPVRWGVPEDSLFSTDTLRLQDYDVEIVFRQITDAPCDQIDSD